MEKLKTSYRQLIKEVNSAKEKYKEAVTKGRFFIINSISVGSNLNLILQKENILLKGAQSSKDFFYLNMEYRSCIPSFSYLWSGSVSLLMYTSPELSSPCLWRVVCAQQRPMYVHGWPSPRAKNAQLPVSP